MSFARRALYFPNGSSLYSRVKKGFWLKRESQPGAIVAHGSSIFHPHRAPPPGFSGRTRDWIFNRIPDFVLPIYAHSAV